MLPCLRLLSPEILVSEYLHGPVETGLVVTAVVCNRRNDRVAVGERRDEILAPDLRRVHADLRGEHIYHPLDHVRGFGPAGAAVGVDRGRVRERR